jgi:hypothetical protein
MELFGRTNRRLLLADRARPGRKASPAAAVFDGRIIKSMKSGEPRGNDAGKKLKAANTKC